MDPLKLSFFRYHFSVSFLIILLISAICQFLWFPQPFLQLDGTWVALLMLASIDIIIGPLLTLLLVSSKKSRRELIIDMVIIAIIQASALTYGLIQIEKERLVALVHYDDVFHLVPKKALTAPLNMKKRIPELKLYQGIPLVMISEKTAIEYNQQSKNRHLPFLYAIQNYQPFNAGSIPKSSFVYSNLPEEMAQKYGENYTFKVLVGKKRTALFVLNEGNTIVDLQLLPQTDK